MEDSGDSPGRRRPQPTKDDRAFGLLCGRFDPQHWRRRAVALLNKGQPQSWPAPGPLLWCQRCPEAHGHHHPGAHPGQVPNRVCGAFWVMRSCATVIHLGILLGGWRILCTVGFAIFKIHPVHAFDTQPPPAAFIFSASALGAPVSTTHVVSSANMWKGSSARTHPACFIHRPHARGAAHPGRPSTVAARRGPGGQALLRRWQVLGWRNRPVLSPRVRRVR